MNKAGETLDWGTFIREAHAAQQVLVVFDRINLDPSPASACTPGDLRERSIWLAPYWCAPIWDVSAGAGIAAAGTGAWHE